MEEISVRLTTTNREAAIERLLDHLGRLGEELDHIEIRVYRHTAIGTDLRVLLERSGHQASLPSQPGLQLAAGLRSIGLVHYASWFLAKEWRR